MNTEVCFMCRCDVSTESSVEEHMKVDHGILYDLDLLLLIQHLDDEEKYEVKSKMTRRYRKAENNFVENSTDEVNVAGYSYKDSIFGGEKMDGLEKDLNSCTPKVEVERSPIASKLSFWEDFTGIRGGNSPIDIDTSKNPVKKDNIVNKLLMPGMSQGCSPKIRMSLGVGYDWNSGKKSNSVQNESRPVRLSIATTPTKSANDTIDVFDDVFASNCNDFNESIDGAFGKLVAEVKLSDDVDDISISSDKSFVQYDLLETSQLCTDSTQALSRTSMEAGQYICPDCRKSFRFLTFLKVHTSSKFLCTRPV